MNGALAEKLASYLRDIRAAYPQLAIGSARLHTRDGQFNDILIADEALIFRFPRSVHVAAELEDELKILLSLQGRLPLPIPNPTYAGRDEQTGALRFIGYPMLPGQPLWNADLDAIAAADEAAFDRLARELAGFLRAIHTLPPASLGIALPLHDTPGDWAAMGAQFRERLFPHMRPDACEEVTRLFAALLDDLREHPTQPALCHGDFGGSNILYDPATLRITGIIDFGGAGLGDPASDVAALSCYGEAFVARGYAVYPHMQSMLPRARLYRGTFALQQALYAMRDGNQEDFDDGIAAYI